jgi:ABC-2 type transport system permease protein
MGSWKATLGDILTVWEKDTKVWTKKPMLVLSRALIFPLVYLVIFANAMGGSLTNLPVAVVDLNGGLPAQQFISAMETGNTIRVAMVPNYAKAMEMFQAREVYAVVVIPAGMEQINLIIDQSSPALAGAINGAVSSAAARYGSQRGLSAGLPVKKDVHYARGTSYLEFLAPGVIIQTIAMGSLFSGGMTLLFEKELGVLNQLLVAPVSKTAIILGKILSAVTQSMTSGVMSIVIAFLLGAKINTGLAGMFFMVILMFLVSFCFIGLGVAMTSYIRDQQAWMMLMQLIVMPLWIVSGTFFPMESLPWWLRPLATISPLTYATNAARNIMIRGFVFSSVSRDLTILAIIASFMFVFGVKSFKRTVE